MMEDPFTAAFKAPDLMEKLAAMPDTRKHLADPGFMAQIEKLRTLATDPAMEGASFEEKSKVSQKIAQAGHHDPRIMQALMSLQGQGLIVDEKDLKHAEDVGDMKRREPVQFEQLELVRNLQDPDEAKTKGNEYFKSGKLSEALAHYERGVDLLRAREEVQAAAVATMLSNAALCYLKLKWPDRAKKSASMAIAVVRQAEDPTFDQSKLFYRRALACEQLKDLQTAVDDMSRALQQAKKASASLAEQHRLKGEVDRLKKLKASNDEYEAKRREQKQNERTAEVERMQGAALVEKGAKKAARADPLLDDGSYIKEQDFSHWARQKVIEAMKGITYDAPSGAHIEVIGLQEGPSKIEASITTKRGKRALYYDMDLHLKWRGQTSSKLKPPDGSGEMDGLFRLYNIGHDTSFKLGGDENTCYMYQLGWDQRVNGPWVEDLRTEAAELFDLVAERVDSLVIAELRKK